MQLLLLIVFQSWSLAASLCNTYTLLARDNYPAMEKVREVSYIAIYNMEHYNLPYSIAIAQLLLESGITESNPQGTLLSQNHNYFGIKYYGDYIPTRISKEVFDSCYAGTIDFGDDCGRCKFMRFKGDWMAFKYHYNFLTAGDQYTKHLHSNDYIGWAYALQEGGYATDKDYAKKIIFIVEKYKLNIIDEKIRNLNREGTKDNFGH